MEKALLHLVWSRAKNRCEYCRLPQDYSILPFEIDHIIAAKHGGSTTAVNLALCCYYDNSFKGPNIAGIDPKSGKLARLFHPRRQRWSTHFRWKGPRLIGRTAVGRTTIAVLGINHPLRVDQRRILIEAGLFP